MYEGECVGSRSVSRSRKRWIDTVKECLRKRGLDARQARRIVHDRSVLGEGICEGECMRRCPGDEPLTLTRCDSCEMPQLFETNEGWKSVLWHSPELRGIKGKFSVFLHFLKL